MASSSDLVPPGEVSKLRKLAEDARSGGGAGGASAMSEKRAGWAERREQRKSESAGAGAGEDAALVDGIARAVIAKLKG